MIQGLNRWKVVKRSLQFIKFGPWVIKYRVNIITNIFIYRFKSVYGKMSETKLRFLSGCIFIKSSDSPEFDIPQHLYLCFYLTTYTYIFGNPRHKHFKNSTRSYLPKV